jgi:hypothetical protein
MRNPFQPHGPVQVPVVDNDHHDGHMMNVLEIQIDHRSAGDKECPESHGSCDKFTPEAQDGVLAMEATTIVWTTPHLIAAYIL